MGILKTNLNDNFILNIVEQKNDKEDVDEVVIEIINVDYLNKNEEVLNHNNNVKVEGNDGVFSNNKDLAKDNKMSKIGGY